MLIIRWLRNAWKGWRHANSGIALLERMWWIFFGGGSIALGGAMTYALNFFNLIQGVWPAIIVVTAGMGAWGLAMGYGVKRLLAPVDGKPRTLRKKKSPLADAAARYSKRLEEARSTYLVYTPEKGQPETPDGWVEDLEEVIGETFGRGDIVWIDGKRFINCVFGKGAGIGWNGGAHQWVNCQLRGDPTLRSFVSDKHIIRETYNLLDAMRLIWHGDIITEIPIKGWKVSRPYRYPASLDPRSEELFRSESEAEDPEK